MAWLRAQSETVNLALRDGLDDPKSHRALRLGISSSQLVAQPQYGLVPLERLALPSSLLGLDGVFGSHLPNLLEAKDDLQAITRWLSSYHERPAMKRSRKVVERFVLWMQVSRKNPSRRPARSTARPTVRSWRRCRRPGRMPHRWSGRIRCGARSGGRPPPSSQKQALVIVQTMFEGLRNAGYLVANPMRAAMEGFALPSSKMNVTRSFTEAEWAHLQRCIATSRMGRRARS